MTTRTSPGSSSGTHHAVQNPYAQTWADAETSVAMLMSTVVAVLERIGSARSNLNWQGGSEQYFQWQVGRQVSYLGGSNQQLSTLRNLFAQALAAGSVVEQLQPLAGGAS